MTLEISHAGRRRDVFSTSALRDSLKQLPTRRPPTPSSDSAALQWELVELDRYVVRLADRTLGYVDVVGAVFVVLVGDRYDRAIEVTQTLLFEEALDALT